MRAIFHFIVLASIIFFPHGGKSVSAETNRDYFSILCIGDLLLVNEAERHILSKGKAYPFEKIKDELLKYDFIFGNLEAPVTERGKPYTNKAYSFRMKPEVALCLRDLKIDAVSISNNHLMDYGDEGMEDTIIFLDNLNIKHSGGGKNITDARKPAVLKRGKVTVYILSYCNRPPEQYYANGIRYGIAPINIDFIREDIAAYKTKNSVVLVSLHWGIEQTPAPQSDQVKTAREIIDSGADGIIGHHPHWPQGIEIYKNRPIIYSLGNFINGYYNPVERDNIGVGLYFYKGGLEKIKVLPIAGQNRKIRFQPYLLTGTNAASSLGIIQNLSKQLGTRVEIKGESGFVPVNQSNLSIGKKDQAPAASAQPN